MLRWIKYGVGAVVLGGVGGVLLLGTNLGSYVRTSTHAAQAAVREAIPMEFELRRAGDMIEAILPDLQAQVRMIAQEEVEITALESDISDSERRLQREQQTLASLRNTMRVQQVSYSVNGRDMTRKTLVDQVQQRFARYKQGELALASKQKLLEKRKVALQSALTMLETMRHRKAELEQKVEALAAQHRLLQASVVKTGNLVDGSELSGADQLLQQIETRLAVAERVLEHEQDLFDVAEPVELIDEHRLLSELDQYFDVDAAGASETLVNR